mgnify:CR=1 FL=1
MVINEIKKEEKIDNKFINEKLISLVIIKFFKPNNVTAPRTGIERRKDIFAESCLLNFKILLAVIAIPDLLTPGTNDNVWKKPIKIADLYEKFFSNSLLKIHLSLI